MSDTATLAHCRVLPPGKLNGMIPETLSINSYSFMMQLQLFPPMLHGNKHVAVLQSYKLWRPKNKISLAAIIIIISGFGIYGAAVVPDSFSMNSCLTG